MRRLLVCALVAVAACGGNGDAEVADDPVATTEVEEAVTTSEASETTTPPETAAPSTTAASTTALAAVPEVFPLITKAETEPGPRPLLAWVGVDGAATYELMVLDADGSPYWAWSGETSSIHLGGMEQPDAVGAWVGESLTWVVTARDADGRTLAISERAELLP